MSRTLRDRTIQALALSFLFAIPFAIVGGCSRSSQPSQAGGTGSNKPTKLVLQLNWYPEAEHGGFYAALVHGFYEKQGLDVEIKAGGRSVVVAPEVTLQRAAFGVANADDVLMARSEDSALVALMAPMQNGPRCIMVREDSGIQSLGELKNIKLQIDSGRPYIPFLKSKGLLDSSVTTVPYYGTVAELVAGPGVAQQAYSFSEPLMAEQQGVKVRNFMLSEAGYNPYASCLVTSQKYLEENPELVRKMVVASVQGWEKYLSDPAETNAYILKQNNQGMTAEALKYGADKLKELCMPSGMKPNELGTMSSERWKTLRDQLTSLKLIRGEKVKAEEAFTLRFLPTTSN